MRVTLVSSPAKKVTGKLGEAIATTQPTFVSEWADHTTTAFTEGSADGSFNGTTDVDLVVFPAASTQRVCRALAVCNEDTISHRVVIQLDNAGSKRTILDETLEAGKVLVLKDGVKYPEITTYNGVLGIAGSGTSTATTGTVQFANGNNLTFGLAGNTMTASASFNQSVQPCVQSLNGSSGSVVFTAGNNITLSQSLSTITISGPNTHAQQTGISGIAGSNASTATAGTVQFANSYNMTFGLNGNTITASASYSQSTQPAVGQLNGSSGTMSISGDGAKYIYVSNNNSTISVGLAMTEGTTVSPVGTASSLGSQASYFALPDHIHAGVPVAGVSGGNTSGTSGTRYGSLMFAGGNNVTLSVGTAAGGQTITISAGAGGGGGLAGLVASNTTYTSGTVALTGSGAATVQSSGAGQTAIINVSAVQALNGSSGALSVAAGEFMSVSNNNSTLTLRNLLSTATTVRPVGTASSLGSQSSYFALPDHAHAGVPVAGISGGNTSNTSGTYYGSLMLAGGNNITLSAATGPGGQTITVSAGAGGGGLGGVAAVGVATTYTSGTVYLSGQANITLATSVDGASQYIRISAPSGGAGGGATYNLWQPYPLINSSSGTIGHGSCIFQPFYAPQNVTASRAHLLISMAVSTSSSRAFIGDISLYIGIYSRTSNSLNTVSTGSQSYRFTNSSNASTSVLSGLRLLSIPININMTPGEYWMAFLSLTNTTSYNYFTASNIFLSGLTNQFSGSFMSATNSTWQVEPGQGRYSNASTNALPNPAAFSAIHGASAAAANRLMWVQFLNSTF